jgi:hypothetical protein
MESQIVLIFSNTNGILHEKFQRREKMDIGLQIVNILLNTIFDV